ncbi:hypothetical protein [Ktedonospora formicarum]|uniref:hypothetical protein n=1 Tax=Ktedonospora formicarum TaxID=2778364 RepID=UPI001C68CC31|nr:hypothetical protein [Ktedonospora formicarum]
MSTNAARRAGNLLVDEDPLRGLHRHVGQVALPELVSRFQGSAHRTPLLPLIGAYLTLSNR